MPESSPIAKLQDVEPISFKPCILSPKQFAIWKSDSDEDMVTAPVSPEDWIGKLPFVTM